MAVGVFRAILWHGSGRLCGNDGHRMALRVPTTILWQAAEMEMPDQVGHDARVGRQIVEHVQKKGVFRIFANQHQILP